MTALVGTAVPGDENYGMSYNLLLLLVSSSRVEERLGLYRYNDNVNTAEQPVSLSSRVAE